MGCVESLYCILETNKTHMLSKWNLNKNLKKKIGKTKYFGKRHVLKSISVFLGKVVVIFIAF